MSILVSATLIWLVFVTLGAASMYRRARRRAPQADFRRSPKEFLWFIPVLAAVAWIGYSMAFSILDARIKLPVRGRAPDRYFSMEHEPGAFWTVFSFEFLLTGLIAMVVFAVLALAIRSYRNEA